MSDVDRSKRFYQRLASKAARDGLVGRGIDVSGTACPLEARQSGPDPERTSYGSFSLPFFD